MEEPGGCSVERHCEVSIPSSTRVRKGSALEVTTGNLPNFIRITKASNAGIGTVKTLLKSESLPSIYSTGPRKCRLSLTPADHSKQATPEFGDAIRAGNICEVKKYLKVHFPDCLFFEYLIFLNLRRVDVETNPKAQSGDVTDSIDSTQVSLKVNSLQLAIIGRQSNVVELFLKQMKDKLLESSLVLKVIGSQTQLTFSLDSSCYYRDDIALDGMNAIHLAAKYDPKALKLILEYLSSNSLLGQSRAILDGKDKQMGMTPLHIAADSTFKSPTSKLINTGSDVNAKDVRGFTPLHVAAKCGNEDILTLLLENGAFTNEKSADTYLQKTPMHRARTGKVVQILLQYDADPFARLCNKNSKDGKGCKHEGQSVFEVLLQRNPGAAEEILNEGISTNFQDLDSPDLMVVYDFELFHSEGGGSDKCQCPERSCSELDEMATHFKIVSLRLRDMLKHPLLESFLHVKWHLTKRFFFVNFIFYTLFLLSLTSLAGLQAAMVKCGNGSSVICGVVKNVNCSTFSNTYETHKFVDILEHCENRTVIVSFYVLLAFLGIGSFLLALREILQAIFSWKEYTRSRENILEIGIILATILYIVFIYVEITVARHLAAWSVFFGWLEMTLLVGRFPSIGIYIYMSTHVIKTLLIFILVYSPALAAFSFAFYILLPYKQVFDNPLTSALKVLVMMIGEFELEDYFIWEAVKMDGGYVSTQILFVLFLIFVCIVIANLLVGLTVSKTEELFKEAGVIRLEKTVLQIVAQENILVKPVGCLSNKWRETMRKMGSVFHFLSDLKNSSNSNSICKKICVRPNFSENNFVSWYYYHTQSPFATTYYDQQHPVFVFDESTGRKGARLPFKLPGWIIVKTLDLLRKRDNSNRFSDDEDDYDYYIQRDFFKVKSSGSRKARRKHALSKIFERTEPMEDSSSEEQVSSVIEDDDDESKKK